MGFPVGLCPRQPVALAPGGFLVSFGMLLHEFSGGEAVAFFFFDPDPLDISCTVTDFLFLLDLLRLGEAP